MVAPQVLIVLTRNVTPHFHQDTGIKGSPGREKNLAFPKSFPALRGLDRSVDGFSMRDDRRSADDVFPRGRRDVDSKH